MAARRKARETFTVDVAASVIADISAGIYRTPAGALKELISNAFDADAATVRISSGHPQFAVFTCSDDGCGMTAEEFKTFMGLVGGSSKRDSGQRSKKYGRPLIGRIGIGILSIAQVCGRFEVFSSKQGEDHKFRASIDLDQFQLPEAQRKKLGQTLDKNKRVRIGECQIEIAPEEKKKHYTRIVMDSVHPGFRAQLRSSPMEKAGTSPKKFKAGNMLAFYKSVSRDTVSEHGAYAQLIWELATTVPVQYLPNGPIRSTKSLDDLRERLASYRFRVLFDGVELLKPIFLPKTTRTERRMYPDLDLQKTLSDGRRLTVRGYLYWQNTRILPRELQGILVRVRNVGIGTYDSTYLGYPKHEGWKFSQLCGELYVDDGLDGALNIDRASFRETDEAYIELQEFLFERLGKGTDQGAGVFTDIKATTKKVRERKRAQEATERRKALGKVLHGRKREVTVEAAETDSKSGVTVRGSTVTVSADLARDVPKKNRELFMSVCAVLEKTLEGKLSAEKRLELLRRVAELFGLR